ncbi:glycosyltransferase family 2 protein [Microbacterium telephonicum]|uniref:Glycosyltransferase involved in cell wall biosynthesis n=1 Tax=Microbacterium telephonicum TaxID=1714841 RepID=A0A498C007_9MICO|nr:glycosyltransferase family 2 protein [Microbacterium telephonicum]RLK49055.1 glycosyltransferase involved in cell wall biosynthesis [Microbacterium telephonicum]
MSTPVVTVIVPGRDVGEFAAEALASLRAQTLDSWCAVLVDDGSTDATTAIFADATATDPRFSLVRHDIPRGLGAARNAGLDLVQTPFVGFLDADDVMTPSALERLVGALDASGSDIAVGAYVRLRPDADGGYTPGIVQPWVSAATAPPRAGTDLTAHPDVSGNIVAWSKVSRIELWRRAEVRFPEGKLYEDQLVAQRLYTLARGIDVVPDVVVHWRERADGSSITQHKDAVPVLADYLEAMRGGIAVLDAAGHAAAARSRVRLILDMDVPPLVRIAQGHRDDAYRRALGAFVRDLAARAEDEEIVLDSDSAPLLSAARLW